MTDNPAAMSSLGVCPSCEEPIEGNYCQNCRDIGPVRLAAQVHATPSTGDARLKVLLALAGASLVTEERLPPGPGTFADEVGLLPGPWYGIRWPDGAVYGWSRGAVDLIGPLRDRVSYDQLLAALAAPSNEAVARALYRARYPDGEWLAGKGTCDEALFNVVEVRRASERAARGAA